MEKTKYKKYKPEALLFSEGDGIFTKSCSTKEIALAEMKRSLKEDELWDDEDIDSKISLEKIKETRMYDCRNCGSTTVGDDVSCYDCGEEMYHLKGRRTFVIYL